MTTEYEPTRVQRLNDAFRKQLYYSTIGDLIVRGDLVVTSGVAKEGSNFLNRAMEIVMSFSEFAEGNDPHCEHDFGQFTINGEKLFWKIDYYDLNMEWGSPDPSNPDVTRPVLTILLADEY